MSPYLFKSLTSKPQPRRPLYPSSGYLNLKFQGRREAEIVGRHVRRVIEPRGADLRAIAWLGAVRGAGTPLPEWDEWDEWDDMDIFFIPWSVDISRAARASMSCLVGRNMRVLLSVSPRARLLFMQPSELLVLSSPGVQQCNEAWHDSPHRAAFQGPP